MKVSSIANANGAGERVGEGARYGPDDARRVPPALNTPPRRPARVPATPIPADPRPAPTLSHNRSRVPTSLHPLNSQVVVAQKVAVGVYKGVTTCELDELAAETAASMTSKHPDYAQVRISPTRTIRTARSTAFSGATHRNVHLRVSVRFKELSTRKTRAIPPRVSTPPLTVRSLNSQLAARIAVSNLHKNTIKSFSET